MTIRTVRVRFITYFYTYSYTRISCLSILSQLLTDCRAPADGLDHGAIIRQAPGEVPK